MMIFMGVVLLIAYVVGTIQGGHFVETMKEANKLEEYSKSEEFRSKSESEQEEYAIKIAVKVVCALIISIILLIFSFCFTIGALSVDVLLVPTVVMLSAMVVKSALLMASKNYREKTNKKEFGTFRKKFSNFINLLYVLYILILIVL